MAHTNAKSRARSFTPENSTSLQFFFEWNSSITDNTHHIVYQLKETLIYYPLSGSNLYPQFLD